MSRSGSALISVAMLVVSGHATAGAAAAAGAAGAAGATSAAGEQATGAGGRVTGGGPVVVWKPLVPGVERAVDAGGGGADGREAGGDRRGDGDGSGDGQGYGDGGLEMFRFDLDRFQAEVVAAARQRPRRARIWIAGARHTAAEVLHHVDAGHTVAVAVVNGGFFDENGRSLGLRVSHDETVVPLRANVDWGVLYVAQRRAHIVHSRDFVAQPGTEAAVQVGPRIVIDGTVPRLKPQVARRTAVALDREGRTLTLVVARAPIEAAVLGNRLAALGFYSALLFDGGPSTQLAVAMDAPATETTIHSLGRLDIPGGYGVPDLLAIVRR